MSGRATDVNDRPHFWPVANRYVVLFATVLLVLAALVMINLMSFAYARLGLDEGWAIAILVASILGSYVNLPIARLDGDVHFEPTLVRAFGMLYVVPRRVEASKILALNVGGGVIPPLLSAYLIVHDDLWWQSAVAVLVVTFVVHLCARVVSGVGVVVPIFVPPVTAALTALAIGGPAVAGTAFVAGTLGTLIGGDLLNLRRVGSLEAAVVSIGGAGTFDGIFVSGVVAVLLATW